MFRPLIANDQVGRDPPTSPTRAVSKAKKASTACLACKQRKTKCSGGHPCEQCGQRQSQCVYDLAADQRRKIANQRNIQELSQKTEDIERFCVILGGVLATIRAGNQDTVEDLVHIIRNRTGLPDLAIYVDSIMTTWPEVYEEFGRVDFYLDDSPRQPSADDSGHRAEQSSTKTEQSRSIDGPVIEGESGSNVELSTSNEHSRSSAEESGRRDSMTGVVMNNHDHTMADGDTSKRRKAVTDGHTMTDGDASKHGHDRRHESMGSGSDGSSSAKSFRPPRPWELP